MTITHVPNPQAADGAPVAAGGNTTIISGGTNVLTNEEIQEIVTTVALSGQAYTIAIAGTNAASATDLTARLGLSTAWGGTNAAAAANAYAGQAWTIAVAGTNAANAVDTTARIALNTSWVGTNAANSANSVAVQAYTIATAGTTSSVQKTGSTMTGNLTVPHVFVGVGTTPTSVAVNGTISYDFTGASWQQTTVDKAVMVSGQNYTAGADIGVILISNGQTFAITYDGNYTFFGTQIPYTVATNGKRILVPLSSITTAASGVLAASTHQL